MHLLEELAIAPSNDRKTRLYRNDKNTFGLMPGLPENGGTCPGGTCGEGGCLHKPRGRKLPICYAHSTMNAYRGVEGVLQRNTDLLLNSSSEDVTQLLCKEFSRYLRVFRRKYPRKRPCYRIHWSGDVPSVSYAKGLRDAILAFPQIFFWGYTRSFFSVPILGGLKNLQLFLSLDPVNKEEGLKTYNKYKDLNIGLSWMGKDLPEDLEFSNAVICPADVNKIPVTGACHNCRLCFGKKTIQFVC